MDKNTTRSRGVRMPKTWYDRLIVIAEQEGKTMNGILLQAIEKFLQDDTFNKH